MSIYIPYFYIIQDTRNGVYYAGSKFSKKGKSLSNPNTFMIEGGYTTSSARVNEIIAEHGLNIFIVRKIRTFKTAEEALDYETRFLVKVNAKSNAKFYNGHNNDGYYTEETKKERMLERYGVDNFAKSPYFPIKFKETSQKKYGADHHLQNPDIMAKHKATNQEKRGVDFVFQCSDFQKNAAKVKQEKYNNPTYVNPEKATETNMEKYGVKRPTQLTHIKEKLADNQAQLYNRTLVHEIKSLIETAKNVDIDYGSLGLKRFWWQSSDEKLLALKLLLETKISNKVASGFEKKTKKQKMQELNARLYNRPIVAEIKKWADFKGEKLGPAWWRKSDEVLQELLDKIKQ